MIFNKVTMKKVCHASLLMAASNAAVAEDVKTSFYSHCVWGLIGLRYLHNGMNQLSASSPLKVPSDAKGKKFRIMSSDVLAAQYMALEAMPVKKPFSEVIARFLFNIGFLWMEEVTLTLGAWFVLFGASLGVKVGAQIGVDNLYKSFLLKFVK
jgi:hypothetical protein